MPRGGRQPGKRQPVRQEPRMQGVVAVYAALMMASSLCSVCGNVLLLLLLLLDRGLQTETWLLTASVSACDLALGLSALPLAAHTSLFQPAGYASAGAWCQGSAFLFLLLRLVSVHSLTWATIDKFAEICFALSYASTFTAGRTRVILAGVWLYALLNAALPLLGFGSYGYSSGSFLCAPSFEPASTAFNMLFMVVGIIVPILTMCSMYGYIVHVARKQVRRGTFVCNENHCFYVPASNYFRSSIVMVTTIVCLLICWLPYITICFYETLTGRESPQVACALATWLVLFTTALNPWITSMTQTRYRSALRRSVSKLRQTFERVCQNPPPKHRATPARPPSRARPTPPPHTHTEPLQVAPRS